MDDQGDHFSAPKIPATLTFVGCVIFALISWWYLTDQRTTNLKENLAKFPGRLTTQIATDLNVRIPALARIVHRWEERGGTPKKEFIAEVTRFMQDLPGFQAIEWVDKSYHVRWVIPLAGNEKAVNLDLGFEERRRQSLEIARKLMHPTMTKPINLVQGGKGLLVYFPINVKGQFEGFLLVVFKTEEWLNYVLHQNSIEEKEYMDFEFLVSMSGDTVFKSNYFQGNINQEWAAESEINVLDQEIKVTVHPTSHFFSHEGRFVALMVSGAFSLFGIVLAILVYALQKASLIGMKIKETNARLETESHERKLAVRAALAANEAKTKFLAAMSHEIRTPLNGVLGILQLVGEFPLQKEVTEKLKIAQDSGFYLLTLVNQVLDFARIEAGAIEGVDEGFFLHSLMADLHSMFKAQADKKGLVFEVKTLCPDGLYVVGNYAHIKQVLFNLIGNSIKFTSKGKVSFVVETSSLDNKKIKLSFEVADTGPGISADEQNIVFEEFKQSECGHKSGTGTGLGLSISKQLVQFMGGELCISSGEGMGASFTFSVLTDEAAFQHVPVFSKNENEVSKFEALRILVAEDNTINQLIIREMLSNDGHEVTLVENGAEAVFEIEKNSESYDLILMDIQMPIMNGIEAAKAIRGMIPDPKILPIHALTANAFTSQVEEYKAAGMQGTLTKPIVQSDLREVLASYSKVAVKDHSKGSKKCNKDISTSKQDFLDVVIIENLIAILPGEQFQNLQTSLPEIIDALMLEMASNDLKAERAISIAHEIKGMAANAGLSYLSSKAQEIEGLARSDADTTELRTKLVEIASDSLEAFSTFLKSPKNESHEFSVTH